MEFDKTLLAGSTGMMVLKLLEQEEIFQNGKWCKMLWSVLSYLQRSK